jgi:ubiquinone biosynthesis protein COQ9
MSGSDDPAKTPNNGKNRQQQDPKTGSKTGPKTGDEHETPASGFAGGPNAPDMNPDELARQRAADEGMEPSEPRDTGSGAEPDGSTNSTGFAGGPTAPNMDPEELARQQAADEGMEPPFSEETADESLGDEDPLEDPHRALQRAILDAALPHIAFDGWNREVLARAAQDAGFSETDADLAFPGGAAEAVLKHAEFADEDMALEMQTLDLASMRTRDKIAIAIRVRLEAQVANREAIRRGLRLLADPRHAPQAARSLAHTVDEIWRLAGDTSTDFNYYSKRGLLAGVYSATLMYWLQDNSEDQHRTWEFLTKRIDEVLRVGKATAGFGRLADRLPNPFRLCSGGRRRWREGPVHR